ncbi:hypothetical protein TA3x_005550 [Tundrisphaera sp. TA3]|uniref:hypothetical protein n=1 Tax=Tundrisphaera sp. TA3 TaxID=3435775 RepID=UPI003EBF0AC1
MPRTRLGLRPSFDSLDPRLVLSASPSNAMALRPAAAIAPAGRTFTPADLQAYADAYLSVRGGVRYNPAYDFNRNGRIDRSDVVPILRGLARSTPKVPFRLLVDLAPEDRARTPHPANNGGVTRMDRVTVVGRTTPNSIIFTDITAAEPGQTIINFRYEGKPVVSDARGRFEIDVKLADLADGGSLTTNNYLVQDPFGHQARRAFPVLRLHR